MLDASAALGLALPSQATDPVDSFFARRPLPQLVAPPVFQLEMRNALLRFERSRLVSEAQSDMAWRMLQEMVACDQFSELDRGFSRLINLARAQQLSFFDACYLDLALRAEAPLASRDAALLAAALRCGVPVEDLR